MAPPVVWIVVGVVGTVAVGYAVKEFVWEPYVAPKLEQLREEFAARRRARQHRREEPLMSSYHADVADDENARPRPSPPPVELQDLTADERGERRLRPENSLRHRSNAGHPMGFEMIERPNPPIGFEPISPTQITSRSVTPSSVAGPSTLPHAPIIQNTPMVIVSPRSLSPSRSAPSPAFSSPAQVPTPAMTPRTFSPDFVSAASHLTPPQADSSALSPELASAASHLSPSQSSSVFVSPQLVTTSIPQSPLVISPAVSALGSPAVELLSVPEPRSPFSDSFSTPSWSDIEERRSTGDAQEISSHRAPEQDLVASDEEGDNISEAESWQSVSDRGAPSQS